MQATSSSNGHAPPQQPNPSTPLNNNTPPNFLNSDHYREWARNLKNSTRLWESLVKFLYQFVVYTGETASLVFTLLTGILLPDGDGEGGRIETLAAILLYFATCFVCVVLNAENKSRLRNSTYVPYSWRNVILNCFMLLKPVRYARVFQVRRRKLQAIRESCRDVSGETRITEEGIKSLVEIYTEEMQDKFVERNEAIFQSIPMALLQLYFLFQGHAAFALCKWDDVSRVVTILFGIFHAAQAVTAFDIASLEYQGSLHFLSFFQSKGAHPMRVYSEGMISLTQFALLVSNLCTMVSNFYVAAYLLVPGWKPCVLFLASQFLLNYLVLFLFPQLEERYCNAPLGVHTPTSYFVQRITNVICGSGTRFQKLSNYKVGCKYKYRMPFVVIQLGITLVALSVVGLLGERLVTQVERDNYNKTVTDILSECPELEEYYEKSSFTKHTADDYLFPLYKDIDSQFQTFSDLFSGFHLNWLLLYVAALASIVYGYGDLKRRKKDPTKLKRGEDPHFREVYPISTAYGFYNVLFEHVTDGSRNQFKMIRKMMLLTVIGDDHFYRLTRFMGIPKLWLNDGTILREARKFIDMMAENDAEVEHLINLCFQSRHKFNYQFGELYRIIDGQSRDLGIDKRLFLVFFSDFDRDMYGLGSVRLAGIFKFMGCRAERY